MLKNKPPNMDNETWDEIATVYDLCQEHGSDPWVIHEQMVLMFENTKPTNEKDLSRDDALLVLRDAGFDETKSIQLLDASGGDLVKALEMGTNDNLMSKAATGEFGPPNVAMEDLQQSQPVVAGLLVGGEDGPPHIPSFDGVDPALVKDVVNVLDITEETQWTEEILYDRVQDRIRSMDSMASPIDVMQTLQYPQEEDLFDEFAEMPAIPPSQPDGLEVIDLEGASEARS